MIEAGLGKCPLGRNACRELKKAPLRHAQRKAGRPRYIAERAFVRRLELIDTPKQRAFSGTAGANDRDDLSDSHLKGDVRKNPVRAVCVAHRFHAKYRLARWPRALRGDWPGLQKGSSNTIHGTHSVNFVRNRSRSLGAYTTAASSRLD
jgi:hypothetical protein